MNLLSKVMPDDDHSRHIMGARAALLAQKIKDTGTLSESTVNYIRFKLGNGEIYGIPYSEIQDVVTVDHIATVPMTPEFVLGVAYWHGKLITVVDLGRFFALSSAAQVAGKHLIATIKHERFIIGFRFNDVDGVDAYAQAMLDKTLLMNNNIKENYIYGIHHGRVTILNIKQVVIDLAMELMQQKGA